jgi:predicted branched-subunit amino acid permease
VEQNNFFAGIRDGFPICLGYLSVSFAFGITAVGMGLDIWQAVLISMLNVTSAGQVAGLPMLAYGGSVIELIATQLVINSRYALMSISVSQRSGKSIRLIDRFLISFVNTDEVFAVATSKPMLVGRRYMYGLTLTPFLGWSFGTFLGALAGNILPTIVIAALDIAIFGMFIAIVVPKAREEKPVLFCVLLACLLSCIFEFVPALNRTFENYSGFVVIICAVLASLIFAFISPLPKENDEEVAVNE